MTVWLELEPNDILFFRGPEPFNAGETGYVKSEFAPTPRTLQGALRAAFLKANGVDMEGYVRGDATSPMVEALGRADEEIKLDLRGPYLTTDGRLCVPAPLDLVERDGVLLLRAPGEDAVTTDIGKVRLFAPSHGATDVEGKWLPLEDLERLLAGSEVSADDLFSPLGTSLHQEPKVGLARDVGSRVAAEGMLYTILTLRAVENAGFAVSIEGLPPEAQRPELLKWGGEGRFVWSRKMEAPTTGTHREEVASQIDQTGRFRLVFLQPALFDGGWLPDGFEREETESGVVRWRGDLAGIRCELVSAALGKPRRIGGWDMKNRRPHPLKPHVPAGSVYFFETGATGGSMVEALDGAKVGRHGNMGFGHVLVGGWR
ncbi:MAG: type III-B CRISPR module-associated protein Cmr3 [Rubrobacter sp.]